MRRAVHLSLVVALVLSGAGCRIFGKPEPVGINDVKSVGGGAKEWDDGAGGVWRHFAASSLTWEGAQAYCDALARASGRRWRLPSPQELLEARRAGISTARNDAFGWVQLNKTWAGEWDTGVTDEAITGVYIDMGDGARHRAVSDELEYTALCVRTDSAGQVWRDAGGAKRWWYVPARADYETAQVTCAELATRRHQPWRLPLLAEATAAVAAGIQSPANLAFGRDYLTFVWTSEVPAILESEQAYMLSTYGAASRSSSTSRRSCASSASWTRPS